MHSSNQDAMQLAIRNFGPIVSAQISLRPLSVFVGPSNTGKTMLSILIYALHQVFSQEFSEPSFLFRTTLRNTDSVLSPSNEYITRVLSSYSKALREGHPATNSKNKKEFLVRVPQEVRDFVLEMFCEYSKPLEIEIERCFGLQIKDLVRYSSRGVCQVRVSNFDVHANEHHEFSFNLRNKSLDCELATSMSILLGDAELRETLENIKQLQARKYENLEYQFRFRDLLHNLVLSMHQRIAGSLVDQAHYLPADRGGIMHVHNLVVASMIKSAPSVGLREEHKAPILTGVLADFLEELILRRRRLAVRWRAAPRRRRFNKFADEIEQSSLEGTVQVEHDELTDYPHFKYVPFGVNKTISLINASSMVSELAPIVLFLRECVSLGNLLIIEEPEAHLHPAQQVNLIRVLAQVAAAGVRVLVTTHSEWITEELSNIVSREGADRQSVHTDEKTKPSLPVSMVGVWLFRSKIRNGRKVGSEIKEIEIDQSGLYPTGYDDIAIELHNDWASATSTIDSSD